MMEPLSIGLIAASVLLAIGTAAFAGLKGWNAWLELKRMELTQGGADRTVSRRPATGSSSPI
jgi:hypothetical protein